MSRYGITFYGVAGVSFYGPDNLVNFDASPFTATATDHRALFLNWSKPTGNWTSFRLVRNSYGFPVNENDGQILINTVPSATPSQYLDTPLAPGQFYYYSIFVYGVAAYNGRDDWRRAGNVMALSVTDYGYTDKIVSLLPTVFTTDTQAEASPNGDADTAIYRYLSLMGFQLDFIRTEYDTLLSVNDPNKVSGGLLPVMATQYGLQYEPSIGMAQLRVLLRNIQHIYKLKGTSVGVEALAESYTGWGCTVLQGANLMLDYNDSSFEESLGRWVANTNCTLSRYVADGSVAAFSTGVNKVAGLAKLLSTASGNMSVKLAGTNAVTSGVPLTSTAQHTFSIYSRAAVSTRTVVPQIDWYDKAGTFISSSTGAGSTNATGGFTVRHSVTASPPATAVYAGFTVTVNSTAAGSEIHYLDSAQFEVAGSASTYQEARDVRILALANRVNECTNPSFENNVTGWTATGTTAITQQTTQALFGTHSMRVVTDSSASAVYHAVTPVAGLTTYTFSAWVYGPAGNYRLQHFQGLPTAGSNSSSSAYTAVPLNTWTRLSYTVTIPATETQTRWTIQGPASSTFYVDGVLVERGGVLNDYFDATSSAVTHPADYIWEGTAGSSRSHYYESRQAKTFRLQNVMADYMWSGMTFTLLVAQAGV